MIPEPDERDPLVITVTVDSSASWPTNPYCPDYDDLGKEKYVEEIAEEYIDAVDAGASICHIHGVRELQDEVQEDGRKLSEIDFDGWRRMHERIRSGTDALVQYGIASARLRDKIRLMDQDPDMMSYAFNAHDEYFNPLWEDEYEPNEIYAIHPRDELREFVTACNENDVKPEIESFHTGAFFNVHELEGEGLFEYPMWSTLFFGWPGGTWTPPTPSSMLNFVEHLPDRTNWNVSCMDPRYAWDMLALAIILGGHVRVGWEDNPYLNPGDLSTRNIAETNAELVEKVVDLAEHLGREVATPQEAGEIVELP